jgi:hypothetical protein
VQLHLKSRENLALQNSMFEAKHDMKNLLKMQRAAVNHSHPCLKQ